MRWMIMVAAALGISACQMEAPKMASNAPKTCGAEALQSLVGQPQSALKGQVLPQKMRVIPLGAPVTMDFSPNRLNVDVDARGIITRVWCG